MGSGEGVLVMVGSDVGEIVAEGMVGDEAGTIGVLVWHALVIADQHNINPATVSFDFLMNSIIPVAQYSHNPFNCDRARKVSICSRWSASSSASAATKRLSKTL